MVSLNLVNLETYSKSFIVACNKGQRFADNECLF